MHGQEGRNESDCIMHMVTGGKGYRSAWDVRVSDAEAAAERAERADRAAAPPWQRTALRLSPAPPGLQA